MCTIPSLSIILTCMNVGISARLPRCISLLEPKNRIDVYIDLRRRFSCSGYDPGLGSRLSVADQKGSRGEIDTNVRRRPWNDFMKDFQGLNSRLFFVFHQDFLCHHSTGVDFRFCLDKLSAIGSCRTFDLRDAVRFLRRINLGGYMFRKPNCYIASDIKRSCRRAHILMILMMIPWAVDLGERISGGLIPRISCFSDFGCHGSTLFLWS